MLDGWRNHGRPLVTCKLEAELNNLLYAAVKILIRKKHPLVVA